MAHSNQNVTSNLSDAEPDHCENKPENLSSESIEFIEAFVGEPHHPPQINGHLEQKELKKGNKILPFKYKKEKPLEKTTNDSPLHSEESIKKLTFAEFQEAIENESDTENLYNAYKFVEKLRSKVHNKIKEILGITEEGAVSIYPALDIKKVKGSKSEEEPHYKVFGYLKATTKSQNRSIRPLTQEETSQAIKLREEKQESFSSRHKKTNTKIRML